MLAPQIRVVKLKQVLRSESQQDAGLELGTADELSDIRVSQLGTFNKAKGNMPDLILIEQGE